MKKQNLLLPMVLLITMFSCTKEEYVINSDDAFDLKANKMEQIGSVFNAMARQPEHADEFISATEMIYKDYTELLPISDEAIVQRGKARGFAFSCLYDAIGRQPVIFNKLDSAATKFLGPYDESIISDELLDITKSYTMTALNDAYARAPYLDSLFNLVSKKYLNFEFIKE